MEGKSLLFKIYAGVDAFDIEVNEKDPEKFIAAVKAIAPTFGGINLEDIKAPECFEIEQRLKAELDIPVMHDDQHGTAIISAAGLINALIVAGKRLRTSRLLSMVQVLPPYRAHAFTVPLVLKGERSDARLQRCYYSRPRQFECAKA